MKKLGLITLVLIALLIYETTRQARIEGSSRAIQPTTKYQVLDLKQTYLTGKYTISEDNSTIHADPQALAISGVSNKPSNVKP